MGLFDAFRINDETEIEQRNTVGTGTELASIFTAQEQMLEEDIMKNPTVGIKLMSSNPNVLLLMQSL